MPIITWVLANWKFVVAVAAVVASFFAGSERTQMKWDLDVAFKIQSAQAKAVENANKIAELEVIKYENMDTIKALKSDLASTRVRVPTVAAATNGPERVEDGDTAAGLVPTAPQEQFDKFRSELERDAFAADEMTERCRVLRDWATQFPVVGE